MDVENQQDRIEPKIFILIFILLAACIVTTGYLYYRHSEYNFRREAEEKLAAVTDLKNVELFQWRKERLGDGSLLFENAGFSGLVSRYFEKPEDLDASRHLQAWLEKYQLLYQYDQIRLLDVRGATRMVLPATRMNTSSVIDQHIPEILRSGKVSLQDFYRAPDDQRIYLAVLVPILEEADSNRPLGLLVMRIDPESYLYPFIKRWPTPSRTAETLLVRRDGNDVIFLNNLRFETNAALNLRSPLAHTSMPAVQAVLGREGIMNGIDYRGVPVLAALRTVPDSPWALVARIDTDEVFTPMQERFWQVIVIISGLIFGAGACVGMVWRRQSLNYYRERAQVAEALRASEKRYRSLFDNMMNGFAYCQMIFEQEQPQDFIYLAVNNAFEKLTGLKNVVGKKISEVIPGIHETDPELFETYGRVVRTGVSETFEIYVEALKMWFSISAYRTEENCFVAVFDVITERKRAEAELHERNAELESFLYTASHDLKSPVVTVRTFLGYLEKDIADNDTVRIDKDFRFIRSAADKMGHLLDDLLEMSRIGRVFSPPVRVAFRALVDEALGAVAGRITEQGVAVKVDDQEVMLVGDRIRLVEIWQNLVENAVKFKGDQQEPCIDIGLQRLGSEIVFFVRDNGIGIDTRYREKVFGLFEKLDPKAEGTGIGLALVKRIVEMYKGRIWLESDGIGKGVCFYFTLPEAVKSINKGEIV